MLSQEGDVRFGLVTELAAVAGAAGARLRAETDVDRDAAQAAADALVAAAGAAMAAGHSLSAIAEVEAQGKEEVRDALRDDTLRSVARSGRRARETRAEHHQAIARAMRLGLSTREIASAADVTHGTVRAISNRMSAGDADDVVADRSRTEMEFEEHSPADGSDDEASWSERDHNW
ncbi:MAG TPA: hypothetical protein VGH67_06280 [Solirubrobacteraceae bacterium]